MQRRTLRLFGDERSRRDREAAAVTALQVLQFCGTAIELNKSFLVGYWLAGRTHRCPHLAHGLRPEKNAISVPEATDALRQAQIFLLAPVYGWFTEGFDTLDLREAKALLKELAS